MGHKRILGKTKDFITGREITDTDDERYRQKIARLLVEERGYEKGDVEVKLRLEMAIQGKPVLSMVDFAVNVSGRSFMVIRYGPGSIVTRERPSLATARLLRTYQVPFTVVTNGEDAEVLDTDSGDVVGSGLESIPDKKTALEQLDHVIFRQLSPERIETEKRVLSAYDWLEHSLECDDDWCEPE